MAAESEFTPNATEIGTQAHDTPNASPHITIAENLVEETNDLSCNVLASSLLVIHDTSRSSKDDESELTRWQELDNPLLEIGEADVESRRDDTSLVEAIKMSEPRHRKLATYNLTGRSIE